MKFSRGLHLVSAGRRPYVTSRTPPNTRPDRIPNGLSRFGASVFPTPQRSSLADCVGIRGLPRLVPAGFGVPILSSKPTPRQSDVRHDGASHPLHYTGSQRRRNSPCCRSSIRYDQKRGREPEFRDNRCPRAERRSQPSGDSGGLGLRWFEWSHCSRDIGLRRGSMPVEENGGDRNPAVPTLV